MSRRSWFRYTAPAHKSFSHAACTPIKANLPPGAQPKKYPIMLVYIRQPCYIILYVIFIIRFLLAYQLTHIHCWHSHCQSAKVTHTHTHTHIHTSTSPQPSGDSKLPESGTNTLLTLMRIDVDTCHTAAVARRSASLRLIHDHPRTCAR